MSLFNTRTRGAESRDIHNAFENPTVPLSAIGLDDAFGQFNRTESGISVTEDSALTLPTFYRCISLLSTVIAGCPLHAFKDPGKEDLKPRILDPNNVQMLYTQFELWELVVCHLALYGNAYVLKVRDAMSRVIDLRPFDPSRVKVKLAAKDGSDQTARPYSAGDKIFEVTRTRKDGSEDNSKPPMILTTYEIMHIPGLGYSGLEGLGVVDQFKQTIGTSIAADKLAGRFYSKGTTLTGILNVKAPLASQTQADEIRRRWISKNGCVSNSAEIAVLDAETSFQPLEIPPEQLQFLESRRWQTTEIARMFGIPPHLVGDVEKSTSWGTGIEQQNVGFVCYTVSGWTNRIEQRVSREVIQERNAYCQFDLDRLMRGSMQERYEAYALGIQWGWINRNEVRSKENLEPGPDEMNDYLTPLNMQAGNAQTEKFDPNAVPLGPQGAPKQPKGKAPAATQTDPD